MKRFAGREGVHVCLGSMLQAGHLPTPEPAAKPRRAGHSSTPGIPQRFLELRSAGSGNTSLYRPGKPGAADAIRHLRPLQ